MFDFDHGNLPDAFESLFLKINDTYAYNTRSACQGKLSLVTKSNTVRHGDVMLQNLGVKTFNKIVDLEF